MRFPIFIPCLLIVLAAQIPLQGSAQQKEHLTPVSYQKTAFIDGERVRAEYVAYTAAKEKMYKDFVEKKKAFDESARKLDKQPSAKLATSRAELQNQYTAGLKQRGAERIAVTKNYEEKIKEAILTVMREGAFTEAKPGKENTGSAGIDITDKVLQKLNQNQAP
jgi:hypothetical protein